MAASNTWSLLGLLVPSLLPAQFCTEVKYGDPVVKDSITKANQIRCYDLKNGSKGEVVVASLASGHHFGYLLLKQKTTSAPVRTLTGTEIAVFTLPESDDYVLEVGARDQHSQDWYQFQIDRLNDPVRSDRICYGWNVSGAINDASQFVIYRFGALGSKTAILRIASGHHFGHAQVYDPAGKPLCSVAGTDTKSCVFTSDGLHTLLVRANDLHSRDWFTVDVRCQTWPCECAADWGNFGVGWPGTGDKIPSLTLDRLPRIGSFVTVDIGNSSGKPAAAVVLAGVEWHSEKTQFDGWLNVVPAAVVPWSLPPGGSRFTGYLPNDKNLCGLALIFQLIQEDAGATKGLAFSRGLRMLIGQ